MNYLKIEHSDVCNGIGLRVVIWLSGCSHKCQKCFNQESWNPNSGIPFDKSAKQEIFTELSKDYISGITITGGDPLYESNLDDVLSLVKEIRISYPEKSIWLYTGYTISEIVKQEQYEKVSEIPSVWSKRWEIISKVDILIDGEYIDEQRDITLKWRGSSNQRCIDVQQSIAQNKIVLYCN